MKLKLDDLGNVVLTDGKPVYIYDDGKEIAFDAPASMQKIHQLNAEAKEHREKAKGFESIAKSFEGLDPVEAAKAVDIVKNLDAKKLIDAGEVDRIKSEMTKALDEKYKPFVDKATALEAELFSEKVGGSFARSSFIKEKVASNISHDLLQAKFGSAFKIENGQVVGYDGKNQIFSRTRPGEIANFDEALEFLIDKYPHRDSILKGSGAVGTGAVGNTSGGGGSNKTIPRSAFNALAPSQQREHVISGGTVTD